MSKETEEKSKTNAARYDTSEAVINCFASTIEPEAGAESATIPPKRIMYAPAGVHTILPTYKGKPIEVTVNVRAEAIEEIKASLDYWKEIMPAQRVFASFNHKGEAASFYPVQFVWGEIKGKPCIVAEPEWTPPGASAVVAASGMAPAFRSFSPSPLLDAEYKKLRIENGIQKFPKGARGSKENPADIIGVAFDCGTLTNMPAFGTMSPILGQQSAASTAADQPNPTKGNRSMKLRFIKPNDGNYAVGSTVDCETAKIDAEAQAKFIRAGVAIDAESAAVFEEAITEAQRLGEENKQFKEQKKAFDRSRVETAIQAAIGRAAIEPKRKIKNAKGEEVLYVDDLRVQAESNPDFVITMVENLNGREDLTKRTVGKDKRDAEQAEGLREPAGLVLCETCSVEEAVRGYAAIQAETRRAEAAGEDWKKLDVMRRQAGRIYEKHLRKFIANGDYFPIQAQWFDGISDERGVQAANSLGTLAATNLVVQDYLVLLKKLLLPFMGLGFDLSSRGGVYLQATVTRKLTVSTVRYWDQNAPGYTDSDGTTVDASVTLDTWAYNQFKVYVGTLSATTRDLFGEQLGQQLYSIGEALFEVWTNLFTVANYDKTATLGRPGFSVGGTPDRKTLIGIDDDFDTLKNPASGRVVVFATNIYNALRQDPYLISYMWTGDTERAKTGVIGERENLMVHKSQSLNSRSDTVLGLATTRSGSLLVSRIPEPIAAAAGTQFPGVRDVITEPDTGISILLTKWVQPDGSFAAVRPEVLFGAAVGNAACGEVLLP